jgi:hypothetical protein
MQNKLIRIEKTKLFYDRKIKKKEYNIGDLVLCDHPKLSNGLSRGLAPRYYGPFEVVGKYDNGCNYLIKQHNKKQARIKQIHINRLITYHKRGHPQEKNKIIDNLVLNKAENKLVYTKNPTCSRWQIKNKISTEQKSQSSRSNIDSDLSDDECS